MPSLDAQYRLTRPVITSEFFADPSLSFTAKGIVVVMTHRESGMDGGVSTTLRSLLNGKDEPDDLANALTELVNAGVITQIFQ